MADFNFNALAQFIDKYLDSKQLSVVRVGTVKSINPPAIAIDGKDDILLTEELFTLSWDGKLTNDYLNKKVIMIRQEGGGHYYVLNGGYELRAIQNSIQSGSSVGSSAQGNYPTVYSGNYWLKDGEMESNARFIWMYLKGKGWTEQAIAGLLGNLETESKMNPGIWENLTKVSIDTPNRGFGIVQWTPPSGLFNYATAKKLDPYAMTTQLDCLHNDLQPNTTGQYFQHPRYGGEFGAVNTGTKYIASTAEPAWLARAFLVNYLRPAVFDQPKRWTAATKWYKALKGYNGEGVGGNAKLETMLKWYQDRIGKVSYSMGARYGPSSYDCSSALFSAMIHAGILPKGTPLGSTETLFGMVGNGKLLKPITRNEVRRGDIFVSGVPGASSYAAGHTGAFVDNSQIIHCTYSKNGIAITPAAGWMGSPPHYYRLNI